MGYFILYSCGLFYGSFLKNENLIFFFCFFGGNNQVLTRDILHLCFFHGAYWASCCFFPLDQICWTAKTRACMRRKGGGAGGRVGEMPPAAGRPQLSAHSCTEPGWAGGPVLQTPGLVVRAQLQGSQKTNHTENCSSLSYCTASASSQQSPGQPNPLWLFIYVYVRVCISTSILTCILISFYCCSSCV